MDMDLTATFSFFYNSCNQILSCDGGNAKFIGKTNFPTRITKAIVGMFMDNWMYQPLINKFSLQEVNG